MKTVDMRHASTNLSVLVQMLQTGDAREIAICVSGEPVAKLVPFVEIAPRRLGVDRGLVWIADDFDAVNPQITEAFEGR
jgi:antitoxin (DNA-binding transcriptional repressor) of toxin-antitoxin stability system